MKFNSINMNVVQLAASNWQLASGNGQRATNKWLLTTGCLQTAAGRRLLGSNPGWKQLGHIRTNHK
jgi:hypothetical protein